MNQTTPNTPDGKDEALKTCPFCDSTPDVFEDGEIQCSNKKCPVRPSARWGGPEVWNTRSRASVAAECRDPECWLRAAKPAAASSPAPASPQPIDMILFCPRCGTQHVDAPESEDDYRARLSNAMPAELAPRWTNPPHRSHLCHKCGVIWRPADVPTNGVAKIATKGSRDTDGEPKYAAMRDWRWWDTYLRTTGYTDLANRMLAEFKPGLKWSEHCNTPAATPPDTPSDAARAAAEEIWKRIDSNKHLTLPNRIEIAAIITRHLAAETPTGQASRFDTPEEFIDAYNQAAGGEAHSTCCNAPTRTANTDYNVCTACNEACDTVAPVPAAGDDEGEQDYTYAVRLAAVLRDRFYAEVRDWQPLDTLNGVLSQIDNMIAGLPTKRTPSRTFKIEEPNGPF